MSEEKAQYNVKPKPGTIRQSCLLPYSDGYTIPTPGEIRTLINELGWSGRQVAANCGIKSGRTVRKWLAEEANNQNDIPYAAWRLLLLESGRITINQQSSDKEDISFDEFNKKVSDRIREHFLYQDGMEDAVNRNWELVKKYGPGIRGVLSDAHHAILREYDIDWNK